MAVSQWSISSFIHSFICLQCLAASHFSFAQVGNGWVGPSRSTYAVLNCSKRDIVRTWGSSSLLAGFARSGTGWGMELSLQGQWMFLRGGLIITGGTWGGIYKRLLFFSLPSADGHSWQYLHGWILVNPGKSWQWPVAINTEKDRKRPKRAVLRQKRQQKGPKRYRKEPKRYRKGYMQILIIPERRQYRFVFE